MIVAWLPDDKFPNALKQQGWKLGANIKWIDAGIRKLYTSSGIYNESNKT